MKSLNIWKKIFSLVAVISLVFILTGCFTNPEAAYGDGYSDYEGMSCFQDDDCRRVDCTTPEEERVGDGTPICRDGFCQCEY